MAVKDTTTPAAGREEHRWQLSALILVIGVLWVLVWGQLQNLDEVPPGQGKLDYGVYLSLLARLPGDVPLILEHLPREAYPAARKAVVEAAAEAGVSLYPTQEQ